MMRFASRFRDNMWCFKKLLKKKSQKIDKLWLRRFIDNPFDKGKT